MDLSLNLVAIIAISVGITLLPFLVLTMTCFAKIVIVFLIFRNALGVQQTPPNLLLNSAAIILSIYIMAPQMHQAYKVVTDTRLDFQSAEGWEHAASEAAKPFRTFLARYATQENRTFFIDATKQIWATQSGTRPTQKDANGTIQVQPMSPAELARVMPWEPKQDDFVILLPSFMVSELSRAFEIGFLIYLPFLAIDIAVSAILMALGMQMMSPNIISTPFKLLMFVLVDGWTRLMQGLVLSYANLQ